MRDIHAHISFGIDDGAKTKEEAILILKNLETKGVTDIILTPHYIENSTYMTNEEERKKIIEELKLHTNINLYIGNEVYVCDDILKLLQKKEISSLNNSRYLLMELPMHSKIRGLENIIYELTRNNIIPVIAHPERYSYVQKDPKYLDKYVEMGVLFQSNYGSVLGRYGRKVQKCVKHLLKNNYITFLGSDIHNLDQNYDEVKLLKKIKRIVKSDDKVKDLVDNNILKVINNEEI